ncbi:MAG: VOC family protein [Polyangiaceae bacterium]|nr:VOC family protein [Polyangiaceae bacterium]
MAQVTTQKITTFLWFDGAAEEAAELYTSVFENSRIVSVMRAGGRVMSVTFELAGQRFIALNGGPHYKFTPAVSLFIACEGQKEVDRIWDALLAGGGKPSQCGWLEDKFGLSWQVIPTVLEKLIGDPDPDKSKRAVEAMMTMQKLDVAKLERAHAGA